jgi:CheY-like chemotaxis protein
MPTTLRSKLPSQVRALDLGPRVLIIDDDATLRRALARGLKRRHPVVEAHDAEVALAGIANGDRYDAILCDLNLSGMSGRQFLFALHAILPEEAGKVVILSGTAKACLDEELLAIVGPRFVEKPATFDEIELVLEDLCRTHARAA